MTSLPQPGPELDARLEAALFGGPPCGSCLDCRIRQSYGHPLLHLPPPYSTSLPAAWLLVEGLIAEGWRFRLDWWAGESNPDPWTATLWLPPGTVSGQTGIASTPALAICRVLLGISERREA